MYQKISQAVTPQLLFIW